MRVLLVSNGYPPGGTWGTEFYTHQLATGLASRGHDVSVLHSDRAPGRARHALAAAEQDGVRLFALANPGDPRKAFASSYEDAGVERVFARLAGELRPDVVHFAHLLWGLSVHLPRLAHAAGAATVATLTDFGLLCHRGQLFDWRLERCAGPGDDERCARCVREPSPYDAPAGSVLVKRACVRTLALLGERGPLVAASDIARRRAVIARATQDLDRWIAPTRALRALCEQHGFEAARGATLVYGIDEARFRPKRGRAAGAARDGAARIGFLGQYLPHKGLEVLLDAVRRVESRLPGSVEAWTVELWGEARGGRHGHYVAALRARSASPRVRWHAPFEPLEAPRVLAGLTALVVPSVWGENAPLAVLQARAAGVPLIASDVPGIREVLEPGRHGVLFPPGDADALARRLADHVEGRLPRAVEPDPAVPFAEHLDAIEAVHAEALAARSAALALA